MADSPQSGPYEKGGSEPSRPGYNPEDLREAESQAINQPSRGVTSDKKTDNQPAETGGKTKSDAGGTDDDGAQTAGQTEQTAGKTGAGGSLYKQSSAPLSQQLKSFAKNRRKVAIATSITSVIVAALVGLLGMSSVFKLDSLMNNIDSKAFARFNASLSARNTTYIKTYMTLRLADIGSDPKNIDTDNLIFRSNKVKTGNPIHDWYATLRASNFEKDAFNRNGIIFTSIAYRDGNQIKFRPAKITYNGLDFLGKPISPGDEAKIRAALSTGDWSQINMDDVVSKYFSNIEDFNNHGEARTAIKKVVEDNTHFFQVIKRRHIRKSIQNQTGVTNWRFFDDTRTKIKDKSIQMRNKIITAMVPDTTKTGKFVQCLFGISDCKFSLDPENDVNKADVGLSDSKLNPNDTIKEVGADGKPVANPATIDLNPAKDVLSKIASFGNVVLDVSNITSTLDSLSKVNSALQGHKLSKGVAIARTAQAVGLYQVLETARDQVKSGNVNAAEFNQFMQVLGPISNNEGWNTVLAGKTSGQTASSGLVGQAVAASPNDPLNKDFYCSPDHQKYLHEHLDEANKEYAYLCPDKQIGASNNATALESAWDSTVGKVVGPVLDAYNGVMKIPVFGGIIKFTNNLIGSASSFFVNAAIKALGLGGDLQKLALYITQQVAGFLGAGPMISCSSMDTCGNAPTGDYVNVAIEGSAGAAEAATRNTGASLTTPVAKANAESNLASYQAEQNSSLKDRLWSTDNPDSLASRSMLAFSTFSFSGLLSKLNPANLFAPAANLLFGHSFAATPDNGYTAAKFAGIQTFDFPPQCQNLDPLSAGPLDGTNAADVLTKAGFSISPSQQDALNSWVTETDSNSFWQTIYQIINADPRSQDPNFDTDAVAEQIYNCNLLDNSVRSGLGYTYGYTADNGLSDGATTPTSGTVPLGLVWPFASKSTSQYNRVDQGWDIQSTPGAPIYAIASGTLHVFLANPGGFGNDYPTEELDSSIGGPSTWVYYGHVHIIASLNGQHVNAGQVIAYANTNDGQNGSAAPPGWLEIGFAAPNSDAPVQKSPSESVATQAGQTMKDLLLTANPVGP